MTTPQHKIGSGFGATSTAAEVLAGIDLTGKLAVVTGGYSGIGLETTRALAAAGAHVVVPARRRAVAAEALAGLENVSQDELDLADPDSVRGFAERFLATGRGIDIFIGSAAIMAARSALVGSGWESMFATNHLGHFALVNRLWPAFHPGSRVVAVSSRGHHYSGIRWDDLNFARGYEKWAAYGQSKTANVLFAVQLDELARDKGIRAFSLHPGRIFTNLTRNLSKEEMIGHGLINEAGEPVGQDKTPEQGAATQVWAATSPQLDGMGGVYLEDCDIAEPAPADGTRAGVRDYAIDPEQAARLWTLSAELTGVDFAHE
ncbi:MAG TPA: SDR family NAD(P)-dependent oxidoreductase [Amycolatopsis sp.]|nr:SDR family NAD(P)-dependent oxidoreductase [Amycolatopsis sp.]